MSERPDESAPSTDELDPSPADIGQPDTSAADTGRPVGDEPGRRARWPFVLTGAALVVLVVFWVWALFFASKESANRIGDTGWAARAQERCAVAFNERVAMTDESEVDQDDPAQVARRADLLDRATEGMASMLTDITATPPTDEKGQALVPMWVEDYETYLDDRRAYTESVRQGERGEFFQHAVEGIPISEKLRVFATANDMPACAPPSDI